MILAMIAGCSSDHDCPADTQGPPVLKEGDVVSFTLLQTTDVHHRAGGTGSSITYSPGDGVDHSGPGGSDQTQGGYARLATEIARIRLAGMSQGIPTLLVDSGDFLMGTVYDLTLGDMPAAMYFIEFMKYDAITLGNHEFDYGPSGLAMFINNAVGEDGGGFTVPIVASNMKTDGVAGTDDDGLEAFAAAGVIEDVMVKTLDNGLKIGMIGLLGNNADRDAPLAPPVTFEHDYAAIQQKVDDLKNKMGAHIVVALSHSGIRDPDGSPSGDDIELARNVDGIDIIASGHEHEQTSRIVMENGTRIICAGHYGTNLAQLDVTAEVGAGVISATLVNHAINDSTPGDPSMNYIMGMIDAGINEAIKPQLGLEINDVIAASGSSNLTASYGGAAENGMGNLVADSLRYMLGGMQGAVGIVANGVVRNSFDLGQKISFADMYSVLPLGMTVDPTQQDVPGYPLMQINLSGAHIKNMCQLTAYVIASQDSAFMAQLSNPAHPYHSLYDALINLGADYYLNISGVQFAHFDASGLYQLVPGSVKIYTGLDFNCQYPPAEIEDDAIYPCVVDIYIFFIMQSQEFQMLLTGLGLPITPLNNNGDPVTLANFLDSRLDRDPAAEGIQEIKEWMAFLTFLTASPDAGGFTDHIIPDSMYGTAALASGDSSRVNEITAGP
jgi:5'-nucleotidase